MVRAAALIALTLSVPTQARPDPWESKAQIPADAAWVFYGKTGDMLWVMPEDITTTKGSYTVWMHGDHRDNPRVPYRSSLWKMSYDCKGTVYRYASSTYMADGTPVNSWDGFQSASIRPGTADSSLEKKLCQK